MFKSLLLDRAKFILPKREIPYLQTRHTKQQFQNTLTRQMRVSYALLITFLKTLKRLFHRRLPH